SRLPRGDRGQPPTPRGPRWDPRELATTMIRPRSEPTGTRLARATHPVKRQVSDRLRGTMSQDLGSPSQRTVSDPAIAPDDVFELAPGFRAAAVACGLKAGGALDLALIWSDRPVAGAGVFTTNRVKAAPVLVDQEVLARAPGIRAVI